MCVPFVPRRSPTILMFRIFDMQTKKIKTLNDHINCATTEKELLRIIATMIALKTPEAQDLYRADDLQDALSISMLEYAHAHKSEIANYEVSVVVGDKVESSTFRSVKAPASVGYLVDDDMNLEDYCDKVVRPVSTELAARVVAKFPDMTEYGLTVRHA